MRDQGACPESRPVVPPRQAEVRYRARDQTHSLGQLLSFTAHAEIVPDHAGERQVYGDKPAQFGGSTRPRPCDNPRKPADIEGELAFEDEDTTTASADVLNGGVSRMAVYPTPPRTPTHKSFLADDLTIERARGSPMLPEGVDVRADRCKR